jgi:hypothetical protein
VRTADSVKLAPVMMTSAKSETTRLLATIFPAGAVAMTALGFHVYVTGAADAPP